MAQFVAASAPSRNDYALQSGNYTQSRQSTAVKGTTAPTVAHLCFGYAAVVLGSARPAGYSFMAELADTTADQISIEAAQPKLDLGVLKDLSSKKIILGILDLGDPNEHAKLPRTR
jgi:5-methyltetrahydropteroyltriglutamate--homocysteine methyltransferase